MAKAYTRGAKRRAKQAMPDLAETPRREKNGRRQRETAAKEGVERDADRTVLKARARRMGLTPDKARDMNRVRLSEQPGMALDIICAPDDATRLWQHFVALTASEARYHRSMGKSIHAKTAKIEMEQERFETRPDDQIDLRTEEERDRDAVTSWMRWQGIIGRLDAHHQKAIYEAYRRHCDMVEAGRVLTAGLRFVEAMRRLDRAM